MIPLALLLWACSPGPRIPGPLGPLGRAPSVHAVVRTPIASARKHASAPEATPAEQHDPAASDLGIALADAASFYLEHEPSGRSDCSGFVCSAASRAGLLLQGNTRSLYAAAEADKQVHTRKRPEIGDLAFFDNTYDRNRNGKNDDELTHVAIVIAIEQDDTIVLAHAGTSKGRSRLRMNLHERHRHTTDAGRVLNDWLRRERPDDRADTCHLAAECWRAFATPDPDPTSN